MPEERPKKDEVMEDDGSAAEMPNMHEAEEIARREASQAGSSGIQEVPSTDPIFKQLPPEMQKAILERERAEAEKLAKELKEKL